MKWCSGCKAERPLGDFDEDKRYPGRLRPKCRKCSARQDAYYQAHRGANIARAKKSLALRGRDAINEYKRNRHRERPEPVLRQNAQQRARKEGCPFELTLRDIIVPKVCPILGIPLLIGTGTASPNSPSLDRIDPQKGYVPGNVMVISHRANTIKSDATPEELRKVADFLDGLQQPK
jgi:hypothetical protein